MISEKHICQNHPEKAALSFCHHCKEHFCSNCLNEGKEYYYCNRVDCFDKYIEEVGHSSPKSGKKGSKFAAVFITIIVLAFAGTIGREIANKLFAPSEEVSVKASEWRTQIISYSGITLETPFQLTEGHTDLPLEYKSMVEDILTYKYSSNPLSINVGYVLYPDEIIPNLDGAAQEGINNMRILKGVGNFSSSISNIEMDDLPGRKINGKFSIQNQQAEFIGVVYTLNSKLWQIICFFISNEENRNTAQRIINSVQIEDYKKLSDQLKENVFLKIVTDNYQPKINESFSVKFILNTRLNLGSQLTIVRLPSFSELNTEENKTSSDLIFNTVNHNGKQFRAAVIKDYTVKATKSGRFLITPFELEVPVSIVSFGKEDKLAYNYIVKTDSTYITVL